jgi:CRP-like cAMP-binding protein
VFAEDDFIFMEGDEGDAFYVIIDGTAEVLKRGQDAGDGHGDDDTVLACLEEGSYFGERALLKGEPRYAGVRVTSPSLLAISLTRQDFEAHGFRKFVPDLY